MGHIVIPVSDSNASTEYLDNFLGAIREGREVLFDGKYAYQSGCSDVLLFLNHLATSRSNSDREYDGLEASIPKWLYGNVIIDGDLNYWIDYAHEINGSFDIKPSEATSKMRA